MSEKWILQIVENAGEMVNKTYKDVAVTVPRDILLKDMEQHLSFLPKNFVWTIGWRTYVWQEKETGKFQELTQEEWEKLTTVGTISYTRDAGGSGDELANPTTDEGVSHQ